MLVVVILLVLVNTDNLGWDSRPRKRTVFKVFSSGGEGESEEEEEEESVTELKKPNSDEVRGLGQEGRDGTGGWTLSR